jgi:hypothetical protein
MGALPHIDEHTTEVAASPGRTWEALMWVAERSFDSRGTARFARLLGCADVEPSGPRPLAAGSALPGFHVDVAAAPQELALAGHHRFSRYALTFRLEASGEKRTLLRAETRAAFPGLKGETYKTLVIRTPLHVLATRRLLSLVRSRAERA